MTDQVLQTRTIIHVVPHASRLGGYERQALLIAKAQSQRGIRVAMVTHKDDAAVMAKWGGLAFPVVGASRSTLGGGTQIDQVAVGELMQHHANPMLHVHAPDYFAAGIVRFGQMHGVPAVVKFPTQGDVSCLVDPVTHPPEVAGPRWFESLRSARQAMYLRRSWEIFAQCQHFIALNSAIERELINAGGIHRSKITLMPNAVEIPALPSPLARDPQCALCIARLEKRKRIHVLMEAAHLVAPTHSEVRLRIAGDGSQRTFLASHQSAQVSLLGSMTDLTDEWNDAGVFLFASEREGCPNAVLEAAARGLPIISTRITGVMEWFSGEKDDGVIFIRSESSTLVEDFAQGWRQLIESTENERRIRSEALRRAAIERCSIEKVVFDQLERVYALAKGDTLCGAR